MRRSHQCCVSKWTMGRSKMTKNILSELDISGEFLKVGAQKLGPYFPGWFAVILPVWMSSSSFSSLLIIEFSSSHGCHTFFFVAVPDPVNLAGSKISRTEKAVVLTRAGWPWACWIGPEWVPFGRDRQDEGGCWWAGWGPSSLSRLGARGTGCRGWAGSGDLGGDRAPPVGDSVSDSEHHIPSPRLRLGDMARRLLGVVSLTESSSL